MGIDGHKKSFHFLSIVQLSTQFSRDRLDLHEDIVQDHLERTQHFPKNFYPLFYCGEKDGHSLKCMIYCG